MQQKDTFLSILDRLSPNQVPKLRLVCKNWRRWIDTAPMAWEAQEPFETAKHWRIKLGHPLKGEKYAMLYQHHGQANVRCSACANATKSLRLNP